MSNVDVHVLVHPLSRKDWLDECLASLQGEPVNTHYLITDGSDQIGKFRAAGYSMGNSEFVAYVDCDDWVLQGAFDALLDGIGEASAACTKQWTYYEDTGEYLARPTGGHHIVLYRRDFVVSRLEEFSTKGIAADKWLVGQACPRRIPFVGYVWRVHDLGWHKRWPNGSAYAA